MVNAGKVTLSKENVEEKVQDPGERINIFEFCKRHLRVGSWANERSLNYTMKELKDVVKDVMELLKKDAMVSTLSPPCVIVGDIHGQYRDLVRILNSQNMMAPRKREQRYGFSTSRFVFLGDYIDRGTHSVECISLLFALKILYPTQYILLRGNHEIMSVNGTSGFKDDLIYKVGPEDGVKLWELFNEAFSWMPIACLVGGKILCVHGGISPHLKSIKDISKIQRPLVNLMNDKLACDLLWSDPIDIEAVRMPDSNAHFEFNKRRGISCAFNDVAVKEACRKLNVLMIVRSHQYQENGFRFYAGRSMVTIFSAPRYMDTDVSLHCVHTLRRAIADLIFVQNKGAVLKVFENGAVSVIQLISKPNAEMGRNDETTMEETFKKDPSKMSSRTDKK